MNKFDHIYVGKGNKITSALLVRCTINSETKEIKFNNKISDSLLLLNEEVAAIYEFARN